MNKKDYSIIYALLIVDFTIPLIAFNMHANTNEWLFIIKLLLCLNVLTCVLYQLIWRPKIPTQAYALLSANNTDVDISIRLFPTFEAAKTQMDFAVEHCCEDCEEHIPNEITLNHNSATSYNNGDLYYWNIIPIDISKMEIHHNKE